MTRTFRTLAGAALLALSLTGCAVVVVGGAGAGGAYLWHEGALSRHYPAPLRATYDAALEAARSLQMAVDRSDVDAFAGSIRGVTVARDQQFTITLERWTDDETRVTVRVGVGDRPASARLHTAIARSLH